MVRPRPSKTQGVPPVRPLALSHWLFARKDVFIALNFAMKAAGDRQIVPLVACVIDLSVMTGQVDGR